MSERKAAVAQIISTLSSEPTPLDTLVFLSGLSDRAVSDWLKVFRSFKLVRIGDWLTDSRGYHTIPMYQWAPGQDDIPAPVKSAAERSREWRERQKGGAA